MTSLTLTPYRGRRHETLVVHKRGYSTKVSVESVTDSCHPCSSIQERTLTPEKTTYRNPWRTVGTTLKFLRNIRTEKEGVREVGENDGRKEGKKKGERKAELPSLTISKTLFLFLFLFFTKLRVASHRKFWFCRLLHNGRRLVREVRLGRVFLGWFDESR